MTTLYVRDGSEFREAPATDIITRAQALIAQRYRTGSPALLDPTRTKDFLRLHLGGRDHEVFGLLHLDNRNRLIAVEDLFRGTIDGASVYPREVVHSVLQHGSAAVILYHNHPSGVSEPSQADHGVTRRIRAALQLIDVRVLDHLIVADPVYSFQEAGLL
jgi:DNA repair protein RadC